MNRNKIIQQIKSKKSFLCIGLDTDLQKTPKNLTIFEFNKEIIDATHDLCVAYKPNFAFYEAAGISGLLALKQTIGYIKSEYPDLLVIADAKRGDIGNTSTMYAKSVFEEFSADAITVAPYMGKDSVEPFLSYTDKWTILLALTSNEGASDFQFHMDEEELYKRVIRKSLMYKNSENLMYVVGATKAEMLIEIRKIIPNHFLLVPGVGAQGGSLEEVCKYGFNQDCGLLVNSSRGIIYASNSTDFAIKAREEAQKLQTEMAQILKERAII
jgi:orotidine-5'-phosphate decarboxylase